MKRLFLYFFCFVLGSFFFAIVGVPMLANLRFALLPVFLFFTILRAHGARSAMPSTVFIALWVFMCFALLTVFWSENPALSATKLFFYAMATTTFAFSSSLLARLNPDINPFAPFAPIFLFILISSAVSVRSSSAYMQGNFQGRAGNANMLGAVFLFTSPWLVTELYSRWAEWRRRYVLLGLGAIAMLLMVLSRSRTMMGSLVCGSSIVFAYFKPSRKLVSLYVLAAIILTVAIVKPELFSELNKTYVLKSREDALESRRDQMRDSYDAAKDAGFWGAGFGVSVNMSRYWVPGSTFSDFGREKGSSILALWEETGAIGTALYGAVLLSLVLAVVRFGTPGTSNPDLRFYQHLMLGYIIGTFASSLFEAWILSPSPLAVLFWSAMGLGFGAMQRCAGMVPESPLDTRSLTAQQSR